LNDVARWVSSLPSEWREDCKGPLFEAAHECYQSPGRVYHAWSHVADCVDKLGTFPCDSGRRVFLALLFHDAIYVPGNSDNEEQSAEEATRLLKQHSSLPDGEMAEISRFIRATKHHRVAPGEKSRDLQATLDIDMSILGAPAETYRAYAEGVRREYCPAVTSETLFAAGRAAFLSNVLAQPTIFHTVDGIARWESTARDNIAGELDSLRASQGLLSRVASSVLRWRQGS
jgi:predicted metal-dependent HD superfamily phosphohydrolase